MAQPLDQLAITEEGDRLRAGNDQVPLSRTTKEREDEKASGTFSPAWVPRDEKTAFTTVTDLARLARACLRRMRIGILPPIEAHAKYQA